MNSGLYQATALLFIHSRDTDRRPKRLTRIGWSPGLQDGWTASHPYTTQDRAFHLPGLAWSKSKPATMAAASKALAAEQLPDGGWRQLASMGSDAYALVRRSTRSTPPDGRDQLGRHGALGDRFLAGQSVSRNANCLEQERPVIIPSSRLCGEQLLDPNRRTWCAAGRRHCQDGTPDSTRKL